MIKKGVRILSTILLVSIFSLCALPVQDTIDVYANEDVSYIETEELASIELADSIGDRQNGVIYGNYMYIVGYTNTGANYRLKIIDISNPSEPREVGLDNDIYIKGNMRMDQTGGIAIYRDKLYIANGSSINRYSLENPEKPEYERKYWSSGSQTVDIQFYKDFMIVMFEAYSGVANNNKLAYFDIDNENETAQPKLFLNHDSASNVVIRGFRIYNDYLYATLYNGANYSKLGVYDLSSADITGIPKRLPSALEPVALKDLSIDDAGTMRYPQCYCVYVNDNAIVIGDQSTPKKPVIIIDCTNINDKSEISNANITYNSFGYTRAWLRNGFFDGTTFYGTFWGGGTDLYGLSILDLANPSEPIHVKNVWDKNSNGSVIIDNGILYTNSGQTFKTYKINSIAVDNIGIADDKLVITGKLSEYIGDDKVAVIINGGEYEATVNDDGTFDFELKPQYNESISVTVSLIRNGNVLLKKDMSYEIKVPKQLSIAADMRITEDGYCVDAEVSNTYSEMLEKAIIICAGYKGNEFVSYATDNIENLYANQNENLQFDLKGEDFDRIKIFAVKECENPIIMSSCEEIKITDNDEISESTEAISGEGKLSITATYDTINKIMHISTGLNEQRMQDAAIILLSAEGNIKFAWAGNTDDNSNVGVKFGIINDGKLSDPYNIYAAVGQNFMTIGNAVTYLYSEDDRKNALKAIEDAKPENIEELIFNSDYKIIYQIDRTEYDKISPESKKEVAKSIAGKNFDDISDIRSEWSKKVAFQIVADEINNAEAGDGVDLIEKNAELLNIKLDGMYSKLNHEAKESLFSTYMKGKGLVNAEAIKDTFENAEKLTVLKTLTAAEIVDNAIIETYHEYLQIDNSDYIYFNGLSKSEKYKVIQKFKTQMNSISEAKSISGGFAEAVKESKSSTGSGSGGKTSSSSGGGGSYSKSPSYSAVQPIKKDDIVADLIDENGNYSFFDDISADEWYYEAVRTLKSKKIIDGTANNKFEPDSAITREEFVKMIVLAFDMYNANAETTFSDTNSIFWHYRYIASAQAAGIIKGVSDSEFGVGKPITREEMAVIINRIIDYKKIAPENSLAESKEFTDKGQESEWASESIENLKNYGYMNGFEDGTFRPAENVSRAMAAQTVYNIVK